MRVTKLAKRLPFPTVAINFSTKPRFELWIGTRVNLFRYASKESSDDAAYESYLKDYAGSAKGQDGEKYMAGSAGGSSIPDYQHFQDYANDKSRATPSDHSQGQQMSYQKYAAGGGSSSWDEQYGWGAQWEEKLKP